MSDILCVTNRNLCQEDFLVRIERLTKANIAGFILREKDLSAEKYTELAEKVLHLCEKQGILCILHYFPEAAEKLGHFSIHLPLFKLRELSEAERKGFRVLGASCHSVEEAKEAEKLGCTYIIAGHIFDTDCKKGLPGRGLSFFQEVCQAVSIPVYGIGGIDCENIEEIRKVGGAGGCMMSSLMTCDNPEELLEKAGEAEGCMISSLMTCDNPEELLQEAQKGMKG